MKKNQGFLFVRDNSFFSVGISYRFCDIPSSSGFGPFRTIAKCLRGVEWVHGLFLFPLVLGKMKLPCKIGSFLCTLDNLLQKNVIVLFFGNQMSKWRSFEKRAIFDLLFTFSSHQGKVTKIPSAHISNTYIHEFCSPY